MYTKLTMTWMNICDLRIPVCFDSQRNWPASGFSLTSRLWTFFADTLSSCVPCLSCSGTLAKSASELSMVPARAGSGDVEGAGGVRGGAMVAAEVAGEYVVAKDDSLPEFDAPEWLTTVAIGDTLSVRPVEVMEGPGALDLSRSTLWLAEDGAAETGSGIPAKYGAEQLPCLNPPPMSCRSAASLAVRSVVFDIPAV